MTEEVNESPMMRHSERTNILWLELRILTKLRTKLKTPPITKEKGDDAGIYLYYLYVIYYISMITLVLFLCHTTTLNRVREKHSF